VRDELRVAQALAERARAAGQRPNEGTAAAR
jgi:hypothetical protein